MLSGTGVRDSVAGGYIDPANLGLSDSVIARIKQWLTQYENAHYAGFEDKAECVNLDQEGISISMEVQLALPESKVEYYSHAKNAKLPLPPAK